MNRGGRPAKASQFADGEGGAAAADIAAARPRGRPRRPQLVPEDSRARPEEAAVRARLLKVDARCFRNMCRTILPNNLPPDGLPLAGRQKQSLVEMLNDTFFSQQKSSFSPQSIFYPLFLNEDGRIREKRLSKLHHRF